MHPDAGEGILAVVMRGRWWWRALLCAVLAVVLPARPGAADVVARGRVVLTEQRVWAVGTPRSETGVSWALGRHVALQVRYLRTANAPMIRAEHDDGVLTGIRVGF